MKIVELTGTCSAGGALTLEGTDNAIGYIEKIVMDYIDGDNLADIVVTNEDGAATTAVLTAANIGVADKSWFPRTPCNKVADASEFTNFADKIFVTGKTKIVIAQGGNAKQFRFLVTLSDQI